MKYDLSPARNAALLFFSVAALLVGGAAAVRGQSALDGFDPNANGIVRVVVVQPDGKILIGGDFTTVSPNGGVAVTRNRIARLNPDGTLDAAFDPNAGNSVWAIVVQADGKILVGGDFNGPSSIGGQQRNRIARLDAVTGAADSFNPNANDSVRSIAVQTDGKILAGGAFNGFNCIGGQTRNRIARLDATTGLADSWNPNVNGGVIFAIAVQADGRILAGGQFNSTDFGTPTIGGQTRNRIARLDATTGLADSFDPDAKLDVYAIAVQADGKILVGGDFNDNGVGAISIGGQARNRIARLDGVTGLADSFDPNANGMVRSIVVQADGKILTGGSFASISLASSIGGQPRNGIARLDAVTGLADSFDPSANVAVTSIAVQPDNKVLVGGFFNTLAPNGGVAVTRNSIARLETDGRLDQTLDLGAVGSFVVTTAIQPDGKILIGGTFATVLGVTRNNIARLNSDGTLDTAFNPNANDEVKSIAVQADGRILASGSFTSIGAQARNRVARLDGTNGLADSFDPNPNSGITSIVVQGDGNILVGGSFTLIGGQPRNRIARLDAATGLADMAFNPNANNTVYGMVVQSDGRILAGGPFTVIGGQPRNQIARLNATTGQADSFHPNATTSGDVDAMTVQADGKILVGGSFTTMGGQPRNHFARLGNDVAALQNLTATPTNIIWTRGGSSPQIIRATFDSSTNNVNYTPLGEGTAAGSSWSLTGLNLPTGQNIYIRARGYYRGGSLIDSDSITESVRNAFLPPLAATPQPLLNIQRSANTNVVLSWATNFPGFTLESNTNLNANAWSVVSPAPSVSGTNNVVTNATVGSPRFYRLRK